MVKALTVRRSKKPAVTETTLRAAEYVRMSTDNQKYSLASQRTAIAAYAAQRGFTIARSYADEGRSGLTISGRDGLDALIRDVQCERADFSCIFVYDVSRWGRFQDVDESAYYEFICKRAGIAVHYCEEEFENDGSLSSILLKSVSRVEAANFSRRLSKRIFLAQSHGVTLGFWRGGPASFGYRRQAVGENGERHALLKAGEQKHFRNERVILVPGPKREIEVVKRIFRDFAIHKKTRTEIANELNARKIYNSRGKPWQMQSISVLLRNEVYLGHNVFNRRSAKLLQKSVKNPREMWVRCNGAFKPIISQTLFDKAQSALLKLDRGRKISDEDLLQKLRQIWKRKGRISSQILQNSKGGLCWATYPRRFGSLMNAYKLIGYDPGARYHYTETAAKIDSIIRATANDIVAHLLTIDENAGFLPELNLVSACNLTMVIAVAWSVADGVSGGRRSRRWEVRKLKYGRSDMTLVIRMNTSNSEIQDYFLLPTCNVPLTKDRKRLRVSDRIFGEFSYRNFKTVLRAIRGRFGMGLTHPSDWSQKINFLSQSAKQVVAAANKKPLKR